MMSWLVRFSILYTLSTLQPVAPQTEYPKGYFRSPLDTTLYLSANFGAIRGNHFHSGIDIRTYGQEGLPVRAVADGYVARIKVSPYGYGRALYINHPNGYTSVYAHLQTFSDEINQYVEQEQYRQKSFDIDAFPARNALKVSQSDLIALSGNSGGSSGAHLHFEIRHTKTEEIIDPLLFGFPVEDKLAPRFANSFIIYEENAAFKHKNGHYPYVEIKQNVISKKWGDTVKVRPGGYAFAAWADDYMTPENSDVGINYLQLYANGKQQFAMELQRFAFDESRMVNCHIDYNDYRARGKKWHKCFVDNGNSLPFYQQTQKFITVAQQQAVSVTIKTNDLAGYADSITFILLGDSTQAHFMEFHPNNKEANEFVYPAKNNIFKQKGYSFSIPKWAVYDTILMTTKSTNHKRRDLYAPYISILKTDIPLQRSFTVNIDVTPDKNIATDKLVVVRLSGKGLRYKSSEGGTYKNGVITATSKSFGVYSVAYDDEAPTITRFSNKGDKISARIADNLSGISTYNAYINGNWWLMEYDAKNDMLTGILPKDLPAGKHEVKIVVTDERKNTKTFTQTIDKP